MVQVLYDQIYLVLAILGVPVLGMLIAVGVIFYKKPDNMIVVFGVILFVAVQYILMMFFFMKKIETMAAKEKAKEATEEAEPEPQSKEEKEDESQLKPEEKRIFPIEEDGN
ncbi:hypothetical protein HN807_08065 [Candidatus Bathyarchaeota archaeon]|jgi:large-conductance mechanosensitive channel|nr:hypothetical protein [Candidatus Bathyarchaeota archaeon]MBT4320940.1 hypothetical protein [Candidatus Bathyarchaeota archaeon]MBT4424737.1 hypothetical protein [Candidatus Bathyarchaeota archaeon]MBT7347021.1 hypothetical protein [Candidatus Bathyarchaeota archaeon]